MDTAETLEQSKAKGIHDGVTGILCRQLALSCVSLKKSVFLLAANTFVMRNDLEVSLAELIQLACRHR